MSDITAIPTLIYEIIGNVRGRHPERPALIGVGGAQGSGKSTACWLLEAANRGRFAHFSMDDVYLTRAERERRAHDLCQIFVDRWPERIHQWSREERARIAKDVYPLLVTRGPPGTHDLGLAAGLIARLGSALDTSIPHFDKAADDRAPSEQSSVYRGPAEAILIDGWCVGAVAAHDDTLNAPPMNEIEGLDRASFWRGQMQANLNSYASFFSTFDTIIYLQAPSWEVVRTWRGQQEAQMLGRALTAEENAALDRFVMHYERITRSMLAGHHSAKWIVHLDEARNVVRVEERS